MPLSEHVSEVVSGCEKQTSQEVTLGHLAARPDRDDGLGIGAADWKFWTWCGWNTTSAPGSPGFKGWFLRMTYAVIILTRLAMGCGCWFGDSRRTPTPATETLIWPDSGHSISDDDGSDGLLARHLH